MMLEEGDGEEDEESPAVAAVTLNLVSSDFSDSDEITEDGEEEEEEAEDEIIDDEILDDDEDDDSSEEESDDSFEVGVFRVKRSADNQSGEEKKGRERKTDLKSLQRVLFELESKKRERVMKLLRRKFHHKSKYSTSTSKPETTTERKATGPDINLKAHGGVFGFGNIFHRRQRKTQADANKVFLDFVSKNRHMVKRDDSASDRMADVSPFNARKRHFPFL